MDELIKHLERLVEEARRKAQDNPGSKDAAYWLGCAFGLETAIDAIKDVTDGSGSDEMLH